jgi:transposase
VPTLPPYIIEPIWRQFEALLPERETGHPLGCHRRRIPDRIVFEKLVQILVFGCAYERIADGACSESTLRRRREEWIELGVMERLRRIALDAYDRLIGLRLTDLVAVDCCMTKAPCGGEKAGRSPVDREKKGGSSAPPVVDGAGVPLGTISAPANRHDSPLLGETLAPSTPWGCWGRRQKGRGCTWTAPTTRPLPAASFGGPSAGRGDLREGQSGSRASRNAVGRGEDELVAQRSQEALVWCTERHGRVDRVLGGILRGAHRREATHPRRLEPLPLGRSPFPTTVTY